MFTGKKHVIFPVLFTTLPLTKNSISKCFAKHQKNFNGHHHDADTKKRNISAFAVADRYYKSGGWLQAKIILI